MQDQYPLNDDEKRIIEAYRNSKKYNDSLDFPAYAMESTYRDSTVAKVRKGHYDQVSMGYTKFNSLLSTLPELIKILID